MKNLPSQHLEIIQKVCRKLRTSFSYYSLEDVEQELFLICAELYEKWDQVRPLENFLMVAAKSKLLTLIREKYYRASDPDSLIEKKRASQDFVQLVDKFEGNFDFSRVDDQDLIDHILDNLPPMVRADFIRLANGVKLVASRKETVYQAVRELCPPEE